MERVQICRRCWKTEECAGQLSLNIKTVVDHPGNDTVLRFRKLLNGVIVNNSVII